MEKKMKHAMAHQSKTWRRAKNMWLMALFCAVPSLLGAPMAEARTEEDMCPTEKYDAVTVQGKYLGWQIPRSPKGTITIRLRDSHVPLHIITTQTRADLLFKDNYDAPVEVTYDFIQHYSQEDKKCLQLYVLKTGKVIEKQKTSKFYH